MDGKIKYMKKFFLITIFFILTGIGIFIFNKLGLKGDNLNRDLQQEEISNDPQNFTHPDLDFSFFYPPKYYLTIIDDGVGESILIQKDGSGMEIYITDFEGVINSNSVKKDITDVKLENLMDINLPSGISAVSFSYKDSSLGEVWNVWFVKNKKIYQVVGQSGNDDVLKMFIQTFSFN